MKYYSTPKLNNFSDAVLSVDVSSNVLNQHNGAASYVDCLNIFLLCEFGYVMGYNGL